MHCTVGDPRETSVLTRLDPRTVHPLGEVHLATPFRSEKELPLESKLSTNNPKGSGGKVSR